MITLTAGLEWFAMLKLIIELASVVPEIVKIMQTTIKNLEAASSIEQKISAAASGAEQVGAALRAAL